MKAVRIHELGGPEVLKYEDCSSPTAGPGQVLVDVQAVGVNFADTMVRSGVMPTSSLPSIIGREAAGVVSAVGEGVTEAAVGDLVTYYGVTTGAYAQQVVVPAERTVKIPEGLDAKAGAAVILQGMTAHCLAYGVYLLKPGDYALVHAGAGGTGLLLIQMAKRAGAYVFATVSTNDKAALAQEAGADSAIIYTQEDFEEKVKRVTGGRGVQVVYDSVGKDTFEKSLNCLAPRGCLAAYGQASGPASPVHLMDLAGGSFFLTFVHLDHYTASREELLRRAGEVMSWVASGELKLRTGGVFPLAEAAEAHRQLESRRSTGKLLLIP